MSHWPADREDKGKGGRERGRFWKGKERWEGEFTIVWKV